MGNIVKLNEVDKVEITTLIDNYIDGVALDGSNIISRAYPVKDGKICNSILAEHGFSAIVTAEANKKSHSVLLDFGFSADGAAFNARALGLNMSVIEALVLSHGHSDHTGAIKSLTKLIGKKKIKLFLHPQAFTTPRYLKYGEDIKVSFPELSREELQKLGIDIKESAKPLSLAEDSILYLGEIPRQTDFEKGMPNAYYEENGKEIFDPILDDTSLVMNLKGKGLVILSGCAHAGIINTVQHARKVTGIDKVHAVMGGFHMTGPNFEPIIGRVIEEFRKINPDYIIPTHCAGRKAINAIEKEFPAKFLLNMSGTKLTFIQP
jgi:7,8-dihydropterin-6-yl-methyl-4-(beta-D-ribofuranosyl)aminobenzene 5'-phosphate synthase